MRFVSSANSRGVVVLRHSGKSLMYNKNNNGPKIETCGTPHLITTGVLTKQIHSFYTFGYDFRKDRACPFTPYNSDFFRRI